MLRSRSLSHKEFGIPNYFFFSFYSVLSSFYCGGSSKRPLDPGEPMFRFGKIKELKVSTF